jgi:hypothetical protein
MRRPASTQDYLLPLALIFLILTLSLEDGSCPQGKPADPLVAPIARCAKHDPRIQQAISTLPATSTAQHIEPELVAAILATESYARGALQTRMEAVLASCAVSLGLQQDLSLGIGQIRSSTALKTVETHKDQFPGFDGSRRFLLGLLVTDSSNARIAQLYLGDLLAEFAADTVDDVAVRRALRTYNGQQSSAAGFRRYEDIVLAVWAQLRPRPSAKLHADAPS